MKTPSQIRTELQKLRDDLRKTCERHRTKRAGVQAATHLSAAGKAAALGDLAVVGREVSTAVGEQARTLMADLDGPRASLATLALIKTRTRPLGEPEAATDPTAQWVRYLARSLLADRMSERLRGLKDLDLVAAAREAQRLDDWWTVHQVVEEADRRRLPADGARALLDGIVNQYEPLPADRAAREVLAECDEALRGIESAARELQHPGDPEARDWMPSAESIREHGAEGHGQRIMDGLEGQKLAARKAARDYDRQAITQALDDAAGKPPATPTPTP